MYISHLIVPPILLHRSFLSKVDPTILALASIAPDIASNVFTMMMEMIRMVLKDKVVIHDKKRPPGWIDVDTGKPYGIGEWTHSLAGNFVLGK